MSAPAEPDTSVPGATAPGAFAAAAGGGSGRPAAGYAIVLPPGWRGIPVRHGTAGAIRKILDEVLGRLGKGQSRDALVRHRIELERRLTAMADRAREQSGLDLYLPVEYVHGTAVPASFVVSEGTAGPAGPAVTGNPAGTGDPAEAGDRAGTGDRAEAGDPARAGDPAEVVAFLLAGQDGATEVAVDGAIGVRTERVAGPDADADIPVGSRRVDYAIAVPGRPGQWLLAVFSTLGSGDPDGEYARILVELFDAMMSTFRWTWE